MKKLINDGWEFLKLPTGSTSEQAKIHSGWTAVDLPHDWLIWQHADLYESADAWYRREVTVDPLPESCILYFEGVYMDCDVLLNDEKIGCHAYGYTSFQVDLTGKLRAGRNELMVHIRHQSPNSRWYSGSGIFRDVYLLSLPENHLVPDSFYFVESETGNGWKLEIEAETSKKDSGLFSCEAMDASGQIIARGQTNSMNGRISLSLELGSAEAWDILHPNLYTLRYTFGPESGEKTFGLRTIEFDPRKGFLLNHRTVKLKGVCLHHDLGALGAAFHEKAARRQLQVMKDMGANALRTSHNPPAPALLDLCDRMGILVIDEAFDMWERPKTTYDYARFFPEHEEEDVALWVRRDRCHPSVILWSIGNEIYDMHADLRGTEVCTLLMNQVHANDPRHHASVTFGCNYMPWEGGQRCADVVKIAGYNYGEKYYEEHHKKHPDWVIYGSETASVLSSRGIYHFPIEKSIMSESDLQCSALGNSNTSWGAEDLKKMITDDLKCPYSMGQFIWSGIDYIGEPTPYHTRSCYFGQADTACFPKDSYYLFQSLWSDRNVLHIGVSWDWNPGQMIDVPVMTNYSRIELKLNGQSLGIRTVCREDPQTCLPVWKVPFAPGTLTANALDEDGNILQTDVRHTSGNTSGLILSAENDSLKGDGHDIAFITVQACDENGYPVENARDRVRISVSGGAYLLGTDNGDSTDTDGYKQNCRNLFGGKLLIIAASDGSGEDAVISAESTEGYRAELKLPVIRSERIPGTSSILRIHEDSFGADRKIPVRKIEISTDESRKLNEDHSSCSFRWKPLPENSQGEPVEWQVTNDAGIPAPFAEVLPEEGQVTVKVNGDGHYYLRALGGNSADHPEFISQIEFEAEGVGKPALNPYQFVSAGLFDFSSGEIGSGNEKGIAFSRDGESMIGFSRIDFGKTGSDRLILPIFALDGKPYQIELFEGDPRQEGRLIAALHYEKPSIWNQYQEETYQLPERLTGIRSLSFRMRTKVHMKGFLFEKQSSAYLPHEAGDADMIYGDSFRREGKIIRDIGNNVSLRFDDMDFGDQKKCRLMICGKTERAVNTMTLRIRNGEGNEMTEALDFSGNGGSEQVFPVHVPGGNCTVTFIFLPGSMFDFSGFRFEPAE